MAEINILSKISDDFLECTICLEPFKGPKILPCLHTFCKGCLEKCVTQQGKDEFPCPTCRSETVIPEGGVAGFKDNFFVVSLSDTIRAHKSLLSKEDDKVLCDLCEEGPAVQGCVVCEEFLCEECSRTHRRYKHSRDHEVVSVVKLKEQLISKMRSFKSSSLPVCPKHRDEKLKFYCEQCKHPICRDCAVLQHKDHKYGYLADTVGGVQADIEVKLEAVECQDVESMITWKQLELEDNSKKAAEDIDTAIEEAIKNLRRKQVELKDKLATVTTDRSKLLSAAADSVESTLGCLSSAVDFTRKIVEHGSDFDVMNVHSDITVRLDPLLKGPTPNIPNCISDVAFNPRSKDKESKEKEEDILGDIVFEEMHEGKLEGEEKGAQAVGTYRVTSFAGWLTRGWVPMNWRGSTK
ncbi:E3 ubiquitin-protein ligase TRIM56-like [Branchiostoma floridae x Branchiostoma japonicum]